jgi:hypothetical protein
MSALLPTNRDALTKSGVFAALTSHGVVPVVSARQGDTLSDPLESVAIANTDDSERVASIVALLSDLATLRSFRDRAMSFAASELAWSRITASWHEFLAGLDRTRRKMVGRGVLTAPSRARHMTRSLRITRGAVRDTAPYRVAYWL